MKKIILLMFICSISCWGQQNYDYIKSLNTFKISDIKSDISRINRYANEIIDYNGSTNQKVITNLEFFMKDPFDKKITDFSLIEALKVLEEIKELLPVEEVNAMISESGNKNNLPKDRDGDFVPDYMDKCPDVKGTYRNNGCPEAQVEANYLESLSALSSSVPSGYSTTTKVIDAISKFLVERTKQELTLTFYENFKGKLNQIIEVKIDDTHTLKINLKEVFFNTNLLFESKNYFETPSLGQTWLVAFQKDLIELPYKIEEQILSMNDLSSLNEFHFAIISYDLIKKIRKGSHPITVINELNEKYNVKQDYPFEIDQIVAFLNLLSNNLSKDEKVDDYKEIKWISDADLKSLSDEQLKYLLGLIYQEGRNIKLFKNIKIGDKSIEDFITKDNYNLLNIFVKKTITSLNSIENKLMELKTTSDENEDLKYINFLNSFYTLFDETLENFYTFTNNSNYYKSDYYTKYKPLINDIVAFNTASINKNYAECLLLTNSFLNNLIVDSAINDSALFNQITFFGNFMVDIINTAKNEGDLKLVIEKYGMPVSSYRIKRQFNSSWDVNAYPGLYLGYEFSGSNSLSYGITAPIGFSYSTKNKGIDDLEKKSASTTIFLSVIDIGAPFSYRFSNDEAEGLPENIKWEQVFSPGLFLIHGFANSPLALGLHAQFSPLLRKISDGNELDNKNIFRIGISLLVDIPLFNLTKN